MRHPPLPVRRLGAGEAEPTSPPEHSHLDFPGGWSGRYQLLPLHVAIEAEAYIPETVAEPVFLDG